MLGAQFAYATGAGNEKSHPRNQKTEDTDWCPLFFATGVICHTWPPEEAVGERAKMPQCGIFTKRYPTKQGEMKQSYALRTVRLCDWGGPFKFQPRGADQCREGIKMIKSFILYKRPILCYNDNGHTKDERWLPYELASVS
jgi:hypothetical protein